MSKDIKPAAWLSRGGDVSRSAAYFTEMGFVVECGLYAIPITHRIVPLDILKKALILFEAESQRVITGDWEVQEQSAKMLKAIIAKVPQ